MSFISSTSTVGELQQFFKDEGGIHLHRGTVGWLVVKVGSPKCGTSKCCTIKYVEIDPYKSYKCAGCDTLVSSGVRCKKCLRELERG